MKSVRRSRTREIASEVTTGGYFARAQQRAARRKSPWNLLDIPGGLAGICFFSWALVHLIWALRNLLVPDRAVPFSMFSLFQSTDIAAVVFGLAPFFAAIPLGMLLSNFVLWCIPPYRRACDREAKGVWHASFKDSQKDLSLLALWLAPPALLASFIAAFFVHW
jgi:hypothetical protein